MRKISFTFFLLGLLTIGGLEIQNAAPALASEKGSLHDEGESEDKKNKKDEEDNDISGGRFEGDPIYVHIKPMIIPVINDNGVEQIVSLILDIHVKDSRTADTLHKNMPRVVDALYRYLYGSLEDGSVKKGKLVNVTKIKSRAVLAVSEVAGRENIVDVLVQAVSQRML